MIAAWSPFLALRYLLTRRINLLSAFGVLFAVWATLVVDGVFTGFVYEIRRDVRRATPDILVTDLPPRTGYESLRGAIEAAGGDDLVASAPRLRHQALVQPLRTPRFSARAAMASEVDFDSMEGGFALLVGVDPALEAKVTDLVRWTERSVQTLATRGVAADPSPALVETDPERLAQWLVPDEVEYRARERADLPHPGDAAAHRSSWPGILLGWRRYPYQRFARIGDPLELLTGVVLDDQGGKLATRHIRMAFAGYYATGYRLVDETSALLPIETLRTLMGHDLSDPGSIDLVTDVAVRLRPDLTPAASEACRARIEAAVQAALPPGSGPCAALDWEAQNAVFLTAVAHEHKMMQFVLFVVMLVAAFVIYATLHMMVVQKWKDVGIVAAVGAAPRQIGTVFLLCGAAVGVVGALSGALVGVLTVQNLNGINDWLFANFGVELFPRVLFDLPRIPVHLTTDWTITVTVAAVALTLLVSWLPARRAARMNPVQALSYE